MLDVANPDLMVGHFMRGLVGHFHLDPYVFKTLVSSFTISRGSVSGTWPGLEK